jgi:hypothetical protein
MYKTSRLYQKTLKTDKFSKIVGYKINMQNLVAFLILKKIEKKPFIIASKIHRNKPNQRSERL